MDHTTRPHVAAACRSILSPVGLASCWHDDGPTAQAEAWVAHPEQVAEDQRTALQFCVALWEDEGPLAGLLSLQPACLLAVANYLTAHALCADAPGTLSRLSTLVDKSVDE